MKMMKVEKRSQLIASTAYSHRVHMHGTFMVHSSETVTWWNRTLTAKRLIDRSTTAADVCSPCSEPNVRGPSEARRRALGGDDPLHLVSNISVEFHWLMSNGVVTRHCGDQQGERFSTAILIRVFALQSECGEQGVGIQVRGFRILREDL